MYHTVSQKKKESKKKKVSGCQKENIALDLKKKKAYRPAKVHVSSKKKTAVLDLDERQSRHHNRDTAALPMSNIVRMATIKVDQGGNKSNSVCSLPSRISKISDKISQKINPHKSSKDFDVQNPEISSATEPPRTAINSQRPSGFSFKFA